jgi:tetratricopeptide (TPR) repeat protein
LAQLEEGFQICDRIGDRAWKCRLLNTLGWCLAEIGSHERSREFNLRAAELARQIGDPEIVANSEINLALDHLALGRPEEAWAFLEPIEAVLSRPGDPWMRWRYALHALHARGQIDLALGEPERVLACAEREIAGAVLHRAPKLEARGLATAGQALLALERWEEAAERITGSLRVAERIRAPRAAWRAHGLLAELERIRGRREQQERHARKRSELVDSAARSLRDTELRRHLIAAGQWPR